MGECEIERMFKLTPKGQIEVVSFTVPRKSTLFQEDIFPDTKDMVAVLSAEQWLAGENANPNFVSMKGEYEPPKHAGLNVDKAAVQETKAAAAAADDDKPPKGEKALLKAWHEQKKKIEELEKKLATAQITIRTMETAASS